MSIQNNQVVSFEYEVKDYNTNELIDSNIGKQPLSFLMGKGHMIEGLEEEIQTMNNGDSSQIIIKPEKAYGAYDQNAIQNLPIGQFDGIELKKNMTLYGQDKDGKSIPVIVKDFNDKEVKVDFNHPLAGKHLYFDISILNVRDASQEEINTGILAENQSSGGCGCASKKKKKEENAGCCGSKHNH